MKKIAVFALLLAGIVGWAVRDEAFLKPSSSTRVAPPPNAREAFAEKLRNNASLRARLEKEYPLVWKELAQKTRHDLAACVVTEVIPGVLKAECR